MSDPRDEFADADIISSGGEGFGAFGVSRWPVLTRIIRSRRARIIAAPVVAAALAGGGVLVAVSQPAGSPAMPAQQIVITNTAIGGAGVVGPDGWAGAAGCRRGRGCPRGLPKWLLRRTIAGPSAFASLHHDEMMFAAARAVVSGTAAHPRHEFWPDQVSLAKLHHDVAELVPDS